MTFLHHIDIDSDEGFETERIITRWLNKIILRLYQHINYLCIISRCSFMKKRSIWVINFGNRISKLILIYATSQLPIYYDNTSDKTEISDVTLACEDEASEAHKVVQLNRSPFFSLRKQYMILKS